jgi:cyclohexanone monooxygenase
MGANIEGKKRSLLAYAGGVGVYKQFCDEVKAKGYEGLEIV